MARNFACFPAGSKLSESTSYEALAPASLLHSMLLPLHKAVRPDDTAFSMATGSATAAAKTPLGAEAVVEDCAEEADVPVDGVVDSDVE